MLPLPRIAPALRRNQLLPVLLVILSTLPLLACRAGIDRPEDVGDSTGAELEMAGGEAEPTSPELAASPEDVEVTQRTTSGGDEASTTPADALLPPAVPAPELKARLELAPGLAPDALALALGLPLASEENEGDGYAGAGWLPLGADGDRALAWSTGPAGGPGRPHALAFYAREGEAWRKLDQLSLDERLLPVDERATAAGEPAGAFPFWLTEDGVEPVETGDGPRWVVTHGGWGANGGSFLLLSIDEDRLTPIAARLEAFPGSTRLEDLDGDGLPELVLDETDGYVFCRACGVAEASYRLLSWDPVAAAFEAVGRVDQGESSPIPSTLSEQADLLETASVMAEAGLWKDALTTLESAETGAPASFGSPALDWRGRLIRMTAEARRELTEREVSPAGMLLHAMFYGDYAAVLEQLRAEDPMRLLGGQTALLEAGWEDSERERIEAATSTALAYAGKHPDWANAGAAYALRGWSRWTATPGDPEAVADLRRAAELLPEDAFVVSLADLASEG